MSLNIKAVIFAIAVLVAVGVFVRAGRHTGEPPSSSEEGDVPLNVPLGEQRHPAAQAPRAERVIVAPEPPDVRRPLAAAARPGVDVSQPQPKPPAANVADGAAGGTKPAYEAPPEDIPSLGRMALTDDDPQRRVEAINLLSGTEDPEAVPFLRRALSDPDAEVRLAIVKSLGEVDFPGDASAELLSTVITDDSDADNRLEALRVLTNIDSDRVAVLARQALNDPDEGVRALAKTILEPDGETAPSDSD